MKFTSKVIHGQQHGRTIGYPTANLDVTAEIKAILGKEGVYAVRVGLGDKKYKGVLFYGQRSLFSDDKLVCEVMLLDFAGDLYGQEIGIEVVKFIRPTIAISDGIELKKLIEEDVKNVKSII